MIDNGISIKLKWCNKINGIINGYYGKHDSRDKIMNT